MFELLKRTDRSHHHFSGFRRDPSFERSPMFGHSKLKSSRKVVAPYSIYEIQNAAATGES
jgi:hypothetical protein